MTNSIVWEAVFRLLKVVYKFNFPIGSFFWSFSAQESELRALGVLSADLAGPADREGLDDRRTKEHQGQARHGKTNKTSSAKT